MRGTPPRHLTAVLVGLLTIGLMACTDDSPEGEGTRTKDGSQTSVEMTEVKGTAALRPKTEVVGGWRTVVQGRRAAAIAEITGADGRPGELYAIDPRSAERTALKVSAPHSWDAATNDSATVVAGDRSKGTGRKPFVRFSTDLTTWETLDVTYPDKGWSHAGVGLDGDVPLLIAARPDGSKVVMRVEGDDVTTHALPAAAGQEIGVVDLVEHRGAHVLVHTESERGDESVTRAMTSADGGKTWRRVDALPGGRGDHGLAGVVSTGTHLVATGWADRQAPLGTSGMVWTSADGRSWKRARTTPISWGENVDTTSPNFHLTAPTLIDGRASFDQTCETCTWTTRFDHDGSGSAQVRDNQTEIDGADPVTAQLPGSPGAGIRWEQGSLVAYDRSGTRQLVRGERGAALSAIERIGSSTYVAVSRGRFTQRGENGWSESTEVTPYVLDTTLERKDWTPKALGQWSDLASATDPESGATVAVGTRYTDAFRADGRVFTDGRWRSAKGLGRSTYESVGGVTHAEGNFLMHLVVAEDGSSATTRQARVYSSPDGSRWTEDSGTWSTRDDAGSSISDVCELADGTAIAVGSSQADAAADGDATTWIRQGGSWTMDVPKIKGKGASFDSCATTGSTTVVSGSLADDDMEWTTTDGTTFTPGKPLPRGVSRGIPHEVDGGLVASGHLDTQEHVGPVIWFSTDGTTWQWAPVEVDDNSATVSVLTAEDDVYAVTSQTSGDRLWTIDEIATTKVSGNGEG